jgi:hypothetical protein
MWNIYISIFLVAFFFLNFRSSVRTTRGDGSTISKCRRRIDFRSQINRVAGERTRVGRTIKRKMKTKHEQDELQLDEES